MKKIYLILLLLLLVILPFTHARSFSIPETNISYTLNPDGIVNVYENLTYNFKGCFTEIYLQKPTYLKILNAVGSCEDKACVFRHDLKDTPSGDQELVLKSDYCDESVTVNFNYDIVNVVNQIEDGSQFFYILYGHKTSVPTLLSININAPGNFDDTNYFIHSEDYNLVINNTQMNISKNVRSYEPMEINLLMPKNWFVKTDYINKDKSTVAEITQLEASWNQDYKDYINTLPPEPKSLTRRILNWIFWLIWPAVLAFLVSVIIWYFYGRELSRKEVNFYETYQRDLPNLEDDPLTANYFIEGGLSKNWFSSGILYLVWKKFYDLEKRGKVFYLVKKKVTKDKSTLPKYVLKIYDFLNKNFTESEINLDDLHKRIGGPEFSVQIVTINGKTKSYTGVQKDFHSLYLSIKKDYDKAFIDNKQFYLKKGKKIFEVVFILLLFISFFANFILIIVYIILFFIYGKKYALIFGRFTKEGRVKNLQWEGFKNYILDFSEIKNHPPRSVILWDAYLVYATAFGVAKEVSKNIKTINPVEASKNTNVGLYSGFIASSSFSKINSVSHSFNSNNSSSRFGGGSSGFSGGGGFGGGGGGGGSGAR